MNKKAVIIIIVIVVVILLAISSWLVYKKFIKKSEDEGTDGDYNLPPINYPGGAPSGGYTTPISFPIKRGMNGDSVIQIQNAINKKCNAGLTPDGAFGPKTESALSSCYKTTSVTEALLTQMKFDSGAAVATKPNVGGFITGAGNKVYLRSDTVSVYSYPSLSSSYLIGYMKKSYFLDKPVGQYLSPAASGFAKIRIGAYKRLSGSDVIGVKDVYVKDTDIQKTPY